MLGRDPAHTILVRVGYVRPFSDIFGRLANDAAKRRALADRLKNAGCNVKVNGRTDWLKVGDVVGPYRVSSQNSAGIMEFNVVINADTREIVKSRVGGRFVGVG